MNRNRIIVAMFVAALAAGCGGPETTSEETEEGAAPAPEEPQAAFSESCGQAAEDAASIVDMEDTVEALDEAIASCPDLAELGAAVDEFPAALDGADLETFVTNRCQYSEDESVLESAICSEVGG